MRKLQIGDVVDKYTLSERLDENNSGGNGDIWKAVTGKSGKNEYALKILAKKHWSDKQRYARFRDEAVIQKNLSDKREPGVLPVLDYCLPEHPTNKNPPWILLPIATPIITKKSKLLTRHSNLTTLRETAFMVKRIATLLNELGKSGISHRDIKPDNIFYYDDDWVLGDFGLIAGPDVTAKTIQNEVVGPYTFIAPEMKVASNDSDGKLADVYSLAKTFWFMASNYSDYKHVPGGQLAKGRLETTISFFHHDVKGVKTLDLLIRASTEDNPLQRLPMSDFLDVLDDWLKPELNPIKDIPNLDNTLDLLDTLTTSINLHRKQTVVDNLIGVDERYHIGSIRKMIQEALDISTDILINKNPSHLYIKKFPRPGASSLRTSVPDQNTIVQNELAGLIGNSNRNASQLAGFSISLRDISNCPFLAGWVVLRNLENGSKYIRAMYIIDPQNEKNIIWEKEYKIIFSELGCIEKTVATIQTDMKNALTESLRQYTVYCKDFLSS